MPFLFTNPQLNLWPKRLKENEHNNSNNNIDPSNVLPLSLGFLRCCGWLFELWAALNPTHHSMFQKYELQISMSLYTYITAAIMRHNQMNQQINKQTNKKQHQKRTQSFNRKRSDFSSFAVYTYDKQISTMFICNSETTTSNDMKKKRKIIKADWISDQIFAVWRK